MNPITHDLQVAPEVTIHAVQSLPRAGHGQGPTIVYLHYWGGSHKTWSKVNDLTSEHYPSLSIDFRGWAQSTGPADATVYSIRDLADDTQAVIDALNIDDFVLVGLSMGAKVAQLLAGRGALSGLKGIVLVSPAPPTSLTLPPDMREQQVHAYDNASSAEFTVRNVLTHSGIPAHDVEVLVDDMLLGTPAAREGWLGVGMTEDITHELQSYHGPALVLAAEHDLVEPRDKVAAEVAARIEGGVFEEVPGSGHLSPIERPWVVADRILNFVRRLDDRGGPLPIRAIFVAFNEVKGVSSSRQSRGTRGKVENETESSLVATRAESGNAHQR